ncbi:MAG: hypothetical protein IV100_10875 [Myxococcales bacterium]|nr:hypothetical protein [Myxococcales bacterium]
MELEREIAELREQVTHLEGQWRHERELIQEVRGVKEKVERLRHDLEDAQRRGDLEKAARLRFGELPALLKEQEGREIRLKDLTQGSRMLKEEVTEEDIAQVVAQWTGVPVSKRLEGENKKLLDMEKRLADRVVNQAQAPRARSETGARVDRVAPRLAPSKSEDILPVFRGLGRGRAGMRREANRRTCF